MERPRCGELEPAGGTGAAVADLVKREAVYLEAEKLLIEEEAVITPLYYISRMFCTKPYVQRTYAPMGIEHIDQWEVLAH